MFGTATVEPATVMQLKRSTGAATVCWYTDPPANLKRLHCLRGEYDLLYFKDPHFAQSLTKQFGLKTSHLEEACNSDWHKPIQDCSINNGILVAGSFYGYRVKMIEVLSDAGIDLMGYGPPPPKWSGSKVRTVYSGLYLNEQNKALYFSSALACLNTFSPRESLSSLNCRVFEICGCGGLMLTEPRPALARCFEPESEYLEFDSQEDCLEKIRYLRENPEQAKAIRARAAKRAHKDHTYEKRLNVILDDLNAL